MENTQPTLCGKMSPAHSVQTTAKTSASSSKNSAKLKEVTPLFLDLRSGGQMERRRTCRGRWVFRRMARA